MPRRIVGLNRCLPFFFRLWLLFAGHSLAADEAPWFATDASGQRQVQLYFFWTSSCPHCQAARPFVEALPEHHAWLRLHSREVGSDRAAANAYCLTLADLRPWQHYAYLGLYNLIYVIPLLLITVLFTLTLGARKLSEEEGRLLKLLSGLTILGLGGRRS